MKVAMVSLEMVPFSKVGGLADVVGSLPKYLPIQTSVITPYYGNITKNLFSKFSDQELHLEPTKSIKILDYQIDICKINYQNIDVFLVCNRELFEREGIYLDKFGKPFEDEVMRYYVFSRAAMELLPNFDIIHCHDWHTSFVILLAKLQNLKNIIFTIHNIAYQGIVEKEKLDFLDNDTKKLLFEHGEYYGKINLMKAAIVLADIVSTVSPNYAYEIQNFPQFGMGLENILKQNSHKVVGILNGIDSDIWNPATDKHIYFNYSIQNVDEGKRKNKEQLLKDFKLKDTGVLFGIVARLDHQKGFDILSTSIERLPQGSFNLFVLGTGNPDIQNSISSLSERYPDYIKVIIGFDEVLARKIYAASDYFIIPSRFEPCGLSQMISYRYGTIPIATKTGGLKDSIVDIFENPSDGTGIHIEYADPNLLYQALQKALQINKEELSKLRKKVMNLDFSWNNSAKEYMKMYQNLTTFKS